MDVAEKEDLIITCKSGITIRMKVADISEQGRATQGVKLIRIDEGDEIAAITRIDVQDETGVITEIEDNTQATNLGEAASDQENGVTS